MKKAVYFILLFVSTIIPVACGNGSSTMGKTQYPKISVEVWLTTGDGDKKLEQQPALNFSSGMGNHPLKIKVSEKITYQEMKGFGAALTNSSAWLIHNSAKRNEVIRALFDTQEGIGVSYVRLPMGASDFVAQPPYTYDDLSPGQTDAKLDSFSISPDQAFIIPVLNDALNRNPQLKVMATPWSAPAWMKTPQSLNGGSLSPPYYRSYANYFVKFIQAYQAEGIKIDAVTVQNEPEHTSSNYPTMRMQAFEQADFIKNHLGPAFQNNGLNTKILIWDHNWDRPTYPLTILNDSDAKAFIAGSAWHCYAGNPDAQSTVHTAHPDKGIYFTECSGGAWDANFGSVLTWNLKNVFIGAIRNWAKTVLLWNLALDENHGPHIGGCDNCRGVVTINQDGTVNYEVEYYIIGHLSKFVQPGAIRIESGTFANRIETVAFRNPDRSKVLVVLNSSSGVISFDVSNDELHFAYDKLPGQSVVTFKWQE